MQTLPVHYTDRIWGFQARLVKTVTRAEIKVIAGKNHSIHDDDFHVRCAIVKLTRRHHENTTAHLAVVRHPGLQVPAAQDSRPPITEDQDAHLGFDHFRRRAVVDRKRFVRKQKPEGLLTLRSPARATGKKIEASTLTNRSGARRRCRTSFLHPDAHPNFNMRGIDDVAREDLVTNGVVGVGSIPLHPRDLRSGRRLRDLPLDHIAH